MLLVDSEIRTFLVNGEIGEGRQTAIENGDGACVTNIGYDLRAYHFTKNGKLVDSCELNPGESTFVESMEIVTFDDNTSGRLSLKNSRIRMGLTLDAPAYQPGHKTRIYFRLTNISDSVLELFAGEKYAMLMFEQLNTSPDDPYDGPFQSEFSFKGLADYKSEYADQIKSVDGKIKDLKSLEKSIYGNVITILSIFVAVFTILNVNISLASQSASSISFVMFNIATLGAISFLAVLMDELLNKEKKCGRALWLVPIVCFVVVIGMALIAL